jgi:hypothetical protein
LACVSMKGCSMVRGMGGGEGDEGEGEKVAVAARGEVGGDCVREASFPTNLA